MVLTEADLRILSRLIPRDGDPEELPTLAEVAKELQVSPSHVSQTVRRLAGGGWVEALRAPARRGSGVRYAARPGVVVQWVSREAGVAATWESRGEVDWQFPLASQVQPEEARVVVVAWLRSLRGGGHGNLLDPVGATGRGRRPRVKHAGADVIVYGSAARGDFRSTSDIDALVLHGGAGRTFAERVEDLAAEVSLATGRSLHVRVILAENKEDALPPGIRRAVRREGVLVYRGLHPARAAEGSDTPRWLYGGRLP